MQVEGVEGVLVRRTIGTTEQQGHMGAEARRAAPAVVPGLERDDHLLTSQQHLGPGRDRRPAHSQAPPARQCGCVEGRECQACCPLELLKGTHLHYPFLPTHLRPPSTAVSLPRACSTTRLGSSAKSSEQADG